VKLYNRNILRRRLGDEARQHVPDRDAVVWSVNTTNFYVLVKVQGSATTIKAHYPRNWTTVPSWLKPGNAVRIRHRSGVQGYIEVVGHGRAIPTPVEGDTLPIPGTQPDGVVSGMEVLPYSGGGMNVIINDGVYRIDGTLYAFVMPVTGYIVMDDPAPMIMGSGILMGWGDTVVPVTFDAAPAAGQGRYDAIVVAADGVVHVVKGTSVSLGTEPAYPTTPAGHIVIDYVFIYGGMTEITAADIGVRWSAPQANTLIVTSSMKDSNGVFSMAWNAGDDTPVGSITVNVKDQYGNSKSISTTMTVSLLIGTGGVGFSGAGPFASSASATIGSSKTFYYERNQLATPEVGPLFSLEFTEFGYLKTLIPLILLDVGGEPV